LIANDLQPRMKPNEEWNVTKWLNGMIPLGDFEQFSTKNDYRNIAKVIAGYSET
jgi:hypothetical protein